jgi:hypothetical protein
VIGSRSRALRWFGWFALFTFGQLALVFLAFSVGMMWLLYPLWPGLQMMRFLPADPRTAGSFIVFPTLAQIALAIGINDLLYAAVFYGLGRLRRH